MTHVKIWGATPRRLIVNPRIRMKRDGLIPPADAMFLAMCGGGKPMYPLDMDLIAVISEVLPVGDPRAGFPQGPLDPVRLRRTGYSGDLRESGAAHAARL